MRKFDNNCIIFIVVVIIDVLSAGSTFNIATVDGTVYKSAELISFTNDILIVAHENSEVNINLLDLDKIWVTIETHKKIISPYVIPAIIVGGIYTGYGGIKQLDDWFDFKISDINGKNFAPVGIWMIVSAFPGAAIGYFGGVVLGGMISDVYNIDDFQNMSIADQREYIVKLVNY